MSTTNISLPDNLKVFIDTHIKTGSYSEYLRELTRRDQKKKLKTSLSILLLEGLESGQPVNADTTYWKNKRISLTSE